ncbi:MAG TPA: hypothetical protein VF516_18650, partial [Kofleriaceae bacterium]
RIVDPVEVQKLPELGVLSAMANPDLEVVSVAMSVVSRLPEDRARLYWDVILAVLPPPLREALNMETEAQRYARMRAELARMMAQQEREEGLRRGVLALVRAKLDAVSREDEAAIEALDDEKALIDLIGELGRATSAAEIRGAVAAARTPR